MVRTPTWALVYDPEVKGHLAAIDTKHHGLIRAAIEEQLQFTPDTETRNRKPLKRPVEFGADWELRFGPDNRFRVFYAMDPERWEVQVLAIGVKEGNRLSIGGEEITI
jgi:hypothetical protein